MYSGSVAVVPAREVRNHRSRSNTPPTVAVAVTSMPVPSSASVQRQRGVTALREAEREQRAVSRHLQIVEHGVGGGEQVASCGGLTVGVEVPVAGDGGVAEAEVVRGDVDKAGAGEDGVRRRAVEALPIGIDVAGDVRVRHTAS
jgi:hypothetical protein